MYNLKEEKKYNQIIKSLAQNITDDTRKKERFKENEFALNVIEKFFFVNLIRVFLVLKTPLVNFFSFL